MKEAKQLIKKKAILQESEKFELIVTNKLDNLSIIGDFIIKTAKHLNLNEDEIFDIETAVEEACANIVEHAYAKDEEGTINLLCEMKNGEFIVKIRDRGRPFDPDAVQLPDLNAPLEERNIGGLGIYFMKSLMDEVNYSFDSEKGNELIMKKYISEKVESRE